MLLMILVVVLLLSLVGGGLGHSRYGYIGWSPAAILLLIAVFLLLTGRFALHT